MLSSTASVVDPVSPTVFSYREDEGGLVWGDYDGDTVTAGRFVGERAGEVVEIAFAHVTTAGALVRGSATSRISRGDDGALLLTEDFTTPDGAAHVSVCRELID